MVYVTGDTHGDFRRFSRENFPEQVDMSKDDKVIICGDFGFWHETAELEYWLDWLEDKPFTTFWVDGNHENYDRLKLIFTDEWNGGKVQWIRPSIIHLMRGQVYDIDGRKVFTMGGAASHDIENGILEADDPQLKQKISRLKKQGKVCFRVNHQSWWEEEIPSEEEYAEAKKNLAAHGNKVDYIFSHCAPTWVVELLGNGEYTSDRLTDFLDWVSENVEYREWYFGHYHDNLKIGQSHFLLYQMVMPISW